MCCESVEGVVEPSVALCLLVKSHTQFCGELGPLVSGFALKKKKQKELEAAKGVSQGFQWDFSLSQVSLLEGSEKREA